MEESKKAKYIPDDYKYIRVGTTIYKEVVKPLLSKKKRPCSSPGNSVP
jgi:hypothetical protein